MPKTYTATFKQTYTWTLSDEELADLGNIDPIKMLTAETAGNVCQFVEDQPEAIHEYITVEEVK